MYKSDHFLHKVLLFAFALKSLFLFRSNVQQRFLIRNADNVIQCLMV